jgi:hypothetical protein
VFAGRAGAGGLAGFGLAGAAACYAAMPAEWSRLALPCFLLWGAATAVGVVRSLPARGRPVPGASAARWAAAAVASIAVAGWAPAPVTVLADLDAPALAGWLTGRLDRGAFLDRRLTTLRELAVDLGARRDLRSVVMIGEIRTYVLPGRPLTERCWGRTWAWSLATEARTPGEIRKRLRQMNARHLAHNFMGEEYPHAWSVLYAWDDAALARWRAFTERWLAIAVAPAHVDEANGAFYAYEILDRPRAAPLSPLPFLPGTSSLTYPVTGSADIHQSHRAALALARRFPGILHVLNLAGMSCERVEDWPGAYRFLAPGVRAGIVDTWNYYGLARAAMRTGRPDEARRCFLRAREINPGLGSSVDSLVAALGAARGKGMTY